jgi:hypothetical protein
MPWPRRRNVGAALGFKSGLEKKVAAQIEAVTGAPAKYETLKIEYHIPDRKAKYTPDFPLPNGIIVETKGRFLTADRQKHLLVKEQHPKLDIRFVFTNPNSPIYKGSPTTHAMWATAHGFKFAKGLIPDAWFEEPSKAR